MESLRKRLTYLIRNLSAPITGPDVKMFGLQRTGTNIVLEGVRVNYCITSREEGREWKHGPIGLSGQDIPVIICCFRHPLAWLTSIYRWNFGYDAHGCPHFRREWSFTDFLANRHYKWPTPIDRWNEMNRHYLDWLGANPTSGFAVRCEDMMSRAGARHIYLQIGEKFHLERRTFLIKTFNRTAYPWDGRLGRKMDFNYYKKHKYLSYYPGDSRLKVIAKAAPDVLAELGYSTDG